MEILDTTAQKHVLQRKDIASLTVPPNSIMPTGFESLPADDLKALLEYLSQAQSQITVKVGQASRLSPSQ